MSNHLRVAVLIDSSRAYTRKQLQGIAAYARKHGPWALFHQGRDVAALLPKVLKQWRPDGVIAGLPEGKLVGQIHRLGVPMVNFYWQNERQDTPSVVAHHEAIVGLAIDHFLGRGFRHFAYCGLPGALFSDLRAEFFRKALASRGFRSDHFRGRRLPQNIGMAKVEAYVMRHSAALAEWLRGLPKPVALLACNDMRGQQVVTVCDQARIAVPDEVAVLGIDNDDVLCELCNPPLSSVDPDAEAVGYEGAALLDRMMHGEPPPGARVLVPPAGRGYPPLDQRAGHRRP